MIVFHGTLPGAPLIGGQDPVSSATLEVLWVSDSYDLAAQFQDGEIRKLEVHLENPHIITDEERMERWHGHGHAYIVRALQAAGGPQDGVIFPETIDGMEYGTVIAIFPRPGPDGLPSVDHAVTLLGCRTYHEHLEDWVSDAGFLGAMPETASSDILIP